MNKTVEYLCENFNKDMYEYLIATYPDSDIRELKETAVYATHRIAVCIFDVILKRDNEWREIYDKLMADRCKDNMQILKDCLRGINGNDL